MSSLLWFLVLAPAVAALVELAGGGANRIRTGTAAVVGAGSALGASVVLAATTWVAAPTRIGSAGAPWLEADGLGLVVALVVATIGLTVLAWARRALEPGPDARRFAAAGSAVLAATLLTASAGRLSVLVLGWVVTTAAVLAMLHHPGDPGRRMASRRAASAMGIGDSALLLGAGIVFTTVGDPALGDLSGAVAALSAEQLAFGDVASVSAITAVAALFALAAMARASQLPFPGWLPGTLAAPTPTSALLHAGVVNAGALLLIRSYDLVAAAPAAAWLLAAGSLATILTAVGALGGRPDVKGALATSTSAQMGFMLLAVAVGAPAAALTHLVGHALYKSAKFLGAGDAVRDARQRRRFAPAVHGRRPAVALSAGLVATVAVVVTGSSVGGWLGGADAWMVGASVLATAAHAAWSWTARHQGSVVRVAAVGAGGLGITAAAYLAIAGGLKRVVDSSVPEIGVGAVPPVLALAVLGAAVAVGLVLLRHPATEHRVRATLAGLGHPPNAVRVPLHRPAHAAAVRLDPVRRSS